MEVYVTAIGIAIQTILFLVGGYAMIIRNDERRQAQADEVKSDVKDMRDELKQLAKVITTQAVQTARIDNITTQLTILQRNYEDLRRGNGIIERR